MNPVQKVELLVDFFTRHSFSIDGRDLLIKAPKKDIEELLNNCDPGKDIDSYFAPGPTGDYYRLAGSKSISCIEVFDSKKSFSDDFQSINYSNNYLIFCEKSKNYLYWVCGEQCKSSNFLNDDFFFSNIFSFKDYIKKWIELGEKANLYQNEHSFIDYYNKIEKTFFLTTFTQKILLKQPSSFPEIDYDTSGRLELFNRCFSANSKDEFPKFLKKNLIDFVDDFDIEERLIESYLKFDRIHKKSNLDFQVYLHDISIDKLKGEYEDFKRESLMPFSQITSKLTIKILSVPITFFTVLFFINKITNPILQLASVFFLFFTSIILNISLKNYFSDLKSIQRLFGKKVKSIKEHSFFINNPDEKTEIREVVDYINEKLIHAKKLIWLNFVIYSLLYFFVCIYLLSPIWNTINPSTKFTDPKHLVVLILSFIFIVVSAIFILCFANHSKTLKRIIFF